ncbi:MAG TPA: FtsW/RodA/SpoVE family cell cycle protein [Oscillospiraceae bacterium]|jgi:rod shape determining protein RodA|nr:rod shape determining protein RodA [Clostridiales bacterium]HOV41021.1 FtsW/RodA/SpoVE family cell cycle protein [Oscillospiraceae bacterium]
MKVVFNIIRQYFKRLDKPLFLVVFACSCLSVVLLYSIVYNKVISNIGTPYKMQAVSMVIGAFCALFLSAIDYQKLAKLWFLYVPASLLLVLLTFTGLGYQRAGADDKAWLNLGFMTLQPSEFLKLAFILSFSYHLSKVSGEINSLKNLALLCLHGAVPVGIIALQGDFGTAMVFLAVFVFMIFSAGLSFKYIIAALIAAPIMAVTAWFVILQPVHRKRVMVLFNPDLDPLGVGNQQRQGKIALGSGRMLGKGLFGGDYSYVPEVQNDFIFSYVGQTLGFVGCIILVGALGFICIKIIINARMAKDDLGKNICIGVFGLIFTHSFINIGMVLGIMPVIGVPLPFISAGGTAMLSMYIAIGLVMSVHAHSDKNYAIFYDAN